MSLWDDILVDDQDDLRIEAGDFVVGPSDGQNVRHLLLAAKGEFRHDGLVGVDAARALKSSSRRNDLLREIRLQVKRESRDVRSIRILDQDVEIEVV